MKVAGTLVIDATAPDFADATAWVQLEDAARVDLAATVVAEVSLPGVNHRTGEVTLVRFALDCPAPPGAYGLRAGITLALGGLFNTRHCKVGADDACFTVPLSYAGPAR